MYMEHPVLGQRLLECTKALVAIDRKSASEIFGSRDDMKPKSFATLLTHVSPSSSMFDRLLSQYYHSATDVETLRFPEKANLQNV